MSSETSELPFSFEVFTAWYEDLRRAALEPARLAFCRLLQEETTRLEVEFGGGRFRDPQSRIKDSVRLWAKLHQPRYRELITEPDDVSDVIDDLVGIRVVCTNKSDVDRFRRVLADWTSLPKAAATANHGLVVEEGSERDYLAHPKRSGYRAYHLNLMTSVARVGGAVTVRGELQVRTLLQDGWGELTHEDSYKPGQAVPPLVSVLSMRMGELLATVDGIAEDIQADLSRDSEADISDPALSAETEPTTQPSSSTVSPEIVVAEAARLVSLLERPTTLAQLAGQLRGTFGPEVSAIWRGPGRFKAFLVEAVPGINIVPKGPSYIIPAGLQPDDSWPPMLRE